GSSEELVQRYAVSIDHPPDKITGPLFHARFFVAGFAFTENPGAHQRRQRQRNETGRKDRNDDGDRKFLENAAKQSRQKNQGNENRRQRQRHRQNGERNFA